MPSIYSGVTVTGVITDLEFDVPVGSPAVRTGTITFTRGRIISL